MQLRKVKSMQALTIEKISKSFANFYAVKDLSLTVPQGTIFGLLGPNGAGKTTTIRMIMGIILPDSGQIRIFGQNNSVGIRDQIGYLPEERGLYRKMKVRDILFFFAELKAVPKTQIEKQIDYWLERLDLAKWQDKKAEELSRGMQQKLQFLLTIFHDPQLIILDEPFAGLDPVNTNLIKDIILEQKKQGKTIIFSTHLMEQVEKMCDSICLINKGQRVLDGALQEVKRRYGHNHVVMEYEGKADFLDDSTLVDSHDDYGQYVEIHLRKGADPQALLSRALDTAKIHRFEVVEPSLNEIFIDVVSGK